MQSFELTLVIMAIFQFVLLILPCWKNCIGFGHSRAFCVVSLYSESWACTTWTKHSTRSYTNNNLWKV